MNYSFIFVYSVVAILPALLLAKVTPRFGFVVALIYLYFVSGSLVESKWAAEL